eukprot:TRINITY_DN1234_c0_g1_i2.p1 TRINITY_DN1234_c0_g1~~TRINITY_DN1234_c0_g1_i2.p1  ORF type:complete len:1420 (-),score=268.82 TRINITY_DN1234_c0_g1_i2:18-4277(-)
MHGVAVRWLFFLNTAAVVYSDAEGFARPAVSVHGADAGISAAFARGWDSLFQSSRSSHAKPEAAPRRLFRPPDRSSLKQPEAHGWRRVTIGAGGEAEQPESDSLLEVEKALSAAPSASATSFGAAAAANNSSANNSSANNSSGNSSDAASNSTALNGSNHTASNSSNDSAASSTSTAPPSNSSNATSSSTTETTTGETTTETPSTTQTATNTTTQTTTATNSTTQSQTSTLSSTATESTTQSVTMTATTTANSTNRTGKNSTTATTTHAATSGTTTAAASNATTTPAVATTTVAAADDATTRETATTETETTSTVTETTTSETTTTSTTTTETTTTSTSTTDTTTSQTTTTETNTTETTTSETSTSETETWTTTRTHTTRTATKPPGCFWFLNRDLPKNKDVAGTPTAGDTMLKDDCAGACEKEDTCRSFVWLRHKGAGKKMGNCWLKRGSPKFHVANPHLFGRIYAGYCKDKTTTTTTAAPTTITTTSTLQTCWSKETTANSCTRLDPYPLGSVGKTSLEVRGSCDALGATCAGFIWDSKSKTATLCKPDTFAFLLGGSNSSNTTFAYKRQKCICTELIDDDGGCVNYNSMTNKQVLMVKGGQAACYDACRAQSWCTNYLPQTETGTSGPALCRLAGPETCKAKTKGGDGFLDNFPLYSMNRTCLAGQGADKDGWYKLASASQEKSSGCTSIGCSDSNNASAADGGASACKASCSSSAKCNTVNFCPANASCVGLQGVGRCCMMSCEGTPPENAVVNAGLHTKSGGWDVYYLDRNRIITTTTTTTTTVTSTTPTATETATLTTTETETRTTTITETATETTTTGTTSTTNTTTGTTLTSTETQTTETTTSATSTATATTTKTATVTTRTLTDTETKTRTATTKTSTGTTTTASQTNTTTETSQTTTRTTRTTRTSTATQTTETATTTRTKTETQSTSTQTKTTQTNTTTTETTATSTTTQSDTRTTTSTLTETRTTSGTSTTGTATTDTHTSVTKTTTFTEKPVTTTHAQAGGVTNMSFKLLLEPIDVASLTEADNDTIKQTVASELSGNLHVHIDKAHVTLKSVAHGPSLIEGAGMALEAVADTLVDSSRKISIEDLASGEGGRRALSSIGKFVEAMHDVAAAGLGDLAAGPLEVEECEMHELHGHTIEHVHGWQGNHSSGEHLDPEHQPGHSWPPGADEQHHPEEHDEHGFDDHEHGEGFDHHPGDHWPPGEEHEHHDEGSDHHPGDHWPPGEEGHEHHDEATANQTEDKRIVFISFEMQNLDILKMNATELAMLKFIIARDFAKVTSLQPTDIAFVDVLPSEHAGAGAKNAMVTVEMHVPIADSVAAVEAAAKSKDADQALEDISAELDVIPELHSDGRIKAAYITTAIATHSRHTGPNETEALTKSGGRVSCGLSSLSSLSCLLVAFSARRALF